MKKHFPILLSIPLLLMSLAACTRDKVDNAFLKSDTVCLSVNGSMVYTYNPLTDQLAYMRDKKQFRSGSDDMGYYYTLTCSEIPTARKQEVRCTLEWNFSGSKGRKSALDFTVEDTDGQGTVWLWCSKEKIGVSVRLLD